MTSPGQNYGMQVDPVRLASLLQAYEQAVHNVASLRGRLAYQAILPEAWAHDAVSIGVKAHYDSNAVGTSGSTLWALEKWQNELQSIRDTLSRMLAVYQTNESDVVASMRRL